MSWCLGESEMMQEKSKLEEVHVKVTQGKRGYGQIVVSDQVQTQAQATGETYKSRPKAILSTGPMYAAGSFEQKYELQAVIGKDIYYIQRGTRIVINI